MIALHPETMWFSQVSRLRHTKDGPVPALLPHRVDQLFRTVFPHDWVKEEGRGWHRLDPRRFLLPRPQEAQRIWDPLIPRDGSLSVEESVRRIRMVFEEERRFWRKDWLVTKPIWLFRFYDHIVSAYPNARFVHVIRDGRAVALSLRRKFIRLRDAPDNVLLEAAARWSAVVSEIDALSGRAAVHEVRYEDFCRDIRGSVKAILDFAGLPLTPFPFRRIPEALPPTNQRALAEADSLELRHVERVQGDLLRIHGYL